MIDIGPAQVADAEGIVGVFRSAMAEEVVRVNVLGMGKSAAFVSHSIEASHVGGGDAFWVAREIGRGVIGFAQVRRGLQSAFINNIHVAPDRQGMGFGRRLIGLIVSGLDVQDVWADVFDGSTVSGELFRRAGFEVKGTYHWHILPPAEQAAGAFLVHDLPQADAVHALFDVSTIRVETPTQTHIVGRLGDGLFRLTTRASIEDPQ